MRKCSLEAIVGSPVHATLLIVATRVDAELNGADVREFRQQEKEALVELGAIRGERIDLIAAIAAAGESIGCSPG
jgi:hypothetical protein